MQVIFIDKTEPKDPFQPATGTIGTIKSTETLANGSNVYYIKWPANTVPVQLDCGNSTSDVRVKCISYFLLTGTDGKGKRLRDAAQSPNTAEFKRLMKEGKGTLWAVTDDGSRYKIKSFKKEGQTK